MPYTSNAEIAAIARGLIDRTLPKSEWNHDAHFAAALWLILSPGHDAQRDMPFMIRAYNLATGVPNTDTDGYHETITIASIRAAEAFVAKCPKAQDMFETANVLLRSPLGRPTWLFEYWTRSALFSVRARRTWVDPDIRDLTFEFQA